VKRLTLTLLPAILGVAILVGRASPTYALMQAGGCGEFKECVGGGTPGPGGPAAGAAIPGVGRGPSTGIGSQKDNRKYPCHLVKKAGSDGLIHLVKICP
jgi:hypothetical protein